MVKVKNGTRLNFVYKGNINNCSNDSYVGWRAGNHIITYMNTNKVSNNYKFNVDTQQGLDDVCIYKFNMRVTFDDVPRGNIIFLNKQPHSECSSTYKICCRNVTAHYIMVIVEDDIIEPTTCECLHGVIFILYYLIKLQYLLLHNYRAQTVTVTVTVHQIIIQLLSRSYSRIYQIK